MNEAAKVSVIIPNYNHGKYLKQRIESVLSQSYQDFELIILDDASSDDSAVLLKKYEGHPKVRYVIINKTNSGRVFKQWIKGIELAKGDYIWIAESDDHADFRFLERTVEKLMTNQQLGMVFTDTYKINAEGETIGQVSKSKPHLLDLAIDGGTINIKNFAHYLLEKLVVVNASSVLFRRSALKYLDVQKLSQFKNAGDVFVYLSIVLKMPIFYLSEPLNFMRFHSQNSTKKSKRSGALFGDKILLLNHYLDDFNEHTINKQPIFRYFHGFFFFSIDYGYRQSLKKLLDDMYTKRFLNKKNYSRIKSILLFYRFLYNGRPYFMRNWLKWRLQKELQI